MGYKRRLATTRAEGDGQEGSSSLCIFGYASRLYDHNEVENGEGTTEGDIDNKHLIPWNGDEGLLVDRYDCRLYLHTLGEFDAASVSVSSGSHREAFDAEKLEEEMCDEERWRDMDESAEMGEGDDGRASTPERRGTQIAFDYGRSDVGPREESSSSEEEIEVPYQIPDVLKLPIGIDLPRTMKESAVIERTAVFVVEKGPQMEVVIKAKQQRSRNPEQFAFLDFDHRLHPFYKYVCKLIREKKYTPTPVKSEMRPKQKKLRRLEELRRKEEAFAKRQQESGNSDDSDHADGYLHPLLTGAGPHKKELSRVEILQESSKSVFSRTPNMEDNVYSSLLKNLNTLIAGPPTEENAGEGDSSKGDENTAKHMNALERETDEARIADYNRWHVTFYGKESPYFPLPPPVVIFPCPSSDMEPAIAVAARYVALNGAQAEERLVEHNGESCEFLFAKSRYYTYYQSRVRQHQEVLSQNYMAAISQMKTTSSIAFADKGIGPVEPSLAGPTCNARTETMDKLPAVGVDGASDLLEAARETLDGDEEQQVLKRERKERARLFAERLLNEKLALKRREQKENRMAPGAEPPDISKPSAGTSSSAIVTADAISNIIDEKIKQVFNPPTQTPRRSSPHRRSPERRKTRRSKRRERTPSPRRRREPSRRDHYRSRRSRSRTDKRRHEDRRKRDRSRSSSSSPLSQIVTSSSHGGMKYEKRRRHKRRSTRRHSSSSSSSESRRGRRR